MTNFLSAIREMIDKDVATRKEIVNAAKELKINHSKVLKQLEKVSHGVYSLTLPEKAVEVETESNVIPFRTPTTETQPEKGYVPGKDPCFVPFGDFNVVDLIVKSKKFMPVVITGDSGNGKTKMVEQACAKNKRNFYRMNITVETDEMDILGHYNLINGETIWEDSPLVEAAKTGGVVLLDEIFAGNPARMLALQGILEGKPFLIKKTGERIVPKLGFNIIATDNTKGDGSESGRYIGTNIQNSAFLERFVMCIEHDYPSKSKEIKMLDKYADINKIEIDDKHFTSKLAQWAEVTRKSYKDGAIDEQVTTRRLFHILDIYSVLADKEQSILYAIARFDEEVRESFVSLYKKIDDTILDPDHQPVNLENATTINSIATRVVIDHSKIAPGSIDEFVDGDKQFVSYAKQFCSSENCLKNSDIDRRVLSQMSFDPTIDKNSILDISEHLRFFYILWSSILHEEEISAGNEYVSKVTGKKEYPSEFYQKIFDRLDEAAPYFSSSNRNEFRNTTDMDDAEILNAFDRIINN
jgi:MoxR-like ATPase